MDADRETLPEGLWQEERISGGAISARSSAPSPQRSARCFRPWQQSHAPALANLSRQISLCPRPLAMRTEKGNEFRNSSAGGPISVRSCWVLENEYRTVTPPLPTARAPFAMDPLKVFSPCTRLTQAGPWGACSPSSLRPTTNPEGPAPKTPSSHAPGAARAPAPARLRQQRRPHPTRRPPPQPPHHARLRRHLRCLSRVREPPSSPRAPQCPPNVVPFLDLKLQSPDSRTPSRPHGGCMVTVQCHRREAHVGARKRHWVIEAIRRGDDAARSRGSSRFSRHHEDRGAGKDPCGAGVGRERHEGEGAGAPLPLPNAWGLRGGDPGDVVSLDTMEPLTARKQETPAVAPTSSASRVVRALVIENTTHVLKRFLMTERTDPVVQEPLVASARFLALRSALEDLPLAEPLDASVDPATHRCPL
ncbi:hypothetical protein DFH09DRAFT_1444833 [Mycena vulgaris]|nr:hypothetical protein DFH09DRAFT_1444833 [Mycena vulgaris]